MGALGRWLQMQVQQGLGCGVGCYCRNDGNDSLGGNYGAIEACLTVYMARGSIHWGLRDVVIEGQSEGTTSYKPHHPWRIIFSAPLAPVKSLTT